MGLERATENEPPPPTPRSPPPPATQTTAASATAGAPPVPDPSGVLPPDPPAPRRGGRKKKNTQSRRQDQGPSTPRLPGQSFAIEHRVQEKKSKYTPFLGEDGVNDPHRFVPFVLEASGRLGPEAKAFLEHLKTLCPFPIMRFCALVSVISVKHNAQMALRWVRFLRHPT